MGTIATHQTNANTVTGVATYALANRRALLEIAAWSKDESSISALFGELNPAMMKKMKNQMNRDVVRVVMMVLAEKALATGRTETEVFSLRQLANVLDAPRAESMQRTLRNWLLPMLSEAGWVEGFVITNEWSTSPHEIEISVQGLDGLIEYLHRCQDIANDIAQQQSSLH